MVKIGGGDPGRDGGDGRGGRSRQAADPEERELATTDPNRLAIELSEWAAQGDWRLYFLHRDRLEKVTPEDVKAVAEKYLRPSNRTVGLFIPTDNAGADAGPGRRRTSRRSWTDYKGREASSAGEAFDRRAAGDPGAGSDGRTRSAGSRWRSCRRRRGASR